MKRIIALGLSVIFLLSLPTGVLAKNFDKPPKSIDEIQPGDTYGKGDG